MSSSVSAYDASGRVSDRWHRLVYNGQVGERTHLESLTYTHKDQIHQQMIAPGTGGALQTVDFDYLTNGMLRKINDVTNVGTDLFAFTLGYDQPGGGGQRNGNISSAQVATATGTQLRWNYGYDGLNRLETVTTPGATDYGSSYQYDALGNLLELTRMGQTETGQRGMIDQLEYRYGTGNRLLGVTDMATGATAAAGYTENGTSNNGYDARGNLTYDGGRQRQTWYNYLNLPYHFIQPELEVSVVYTSGGGKVSQTQTVRGQVTERYYLGPAEYENGELRALHLPTGRVVPTILRTNQLTGPDCDPTSVPDIPVEPGDDPTGEPGEPGEPGELGKYTPFLKGDYTIWEGSETSVMAELPESRELAFTGEGMVELTAGFSTGEKTQFIVTTKPCGEEVTWQYEYYLKDHLGNTRMRFADLDADGVVDVGTEVLGEHHYYGFGMEMVGEWSGGADGARRRYNGKEYSEELGLYDYGARWYDPAIARWISVDPLASSMASWSSYNYTFDNPILFIDPDGLAPQLRRDKDGNIIYESRSVPKKYPYASGRQELLQRGVIFADNGTEIEVFVNLSNDEGFNTDCHGISFADGEFWINNNQVENLLSGDGFEQVEESAAQVGNIVVYTNADGDVEHSMTVTGVDSETGEITVTGLGGVQTEQASTSIENGWRDGSTRTVYRAPDDRGTVPPPYNAAVDNTTVVHQVDPPRL